VFFLVFSPLLLFAIKKIPQTITFTYLRKSQISFIERFSSLLAASFCLEGYIFFLELHLFFFLGGFFCDLKYYFFKTKIFFCLPNAIFFV